ncbi:MAG: precorrin-4 C(11)-methyltransferase [Chloroflexota bacterium]|nr:MAG: precorrin-4 C(11)-methyltransferase [Chloroflexota bacterium]
MGNNHSQVYFIGAGPGDPELLTIKGKRIIETADVVIWADSLVNPEVAGLARSDAEVYGSASMSLEEIVAIMVRAAREGMTVARVHTGDPAIFGAILEQMAALEREGVAYSVVPGVSSLFAAAAALQTELTAPEVAQTVIITRAAGRTPVPERESLRSLAAHRATLALFLSAGMIEKAVVELIEGGYESSTPAAIVYRASWPDEQVIRGTLGEITALGRQSGIVQQALILVGQALDPALKSADAQRSRLYDGSFAHGRRGKKLETSSGL